MRQFSLSSIIPILLFGFACKHTSEPPSIPQPPDTASVKTQIDIPWPGLANSPWPMIFHDPQHTGRSPYRGPQLGQVEWQFDASGLVYSSPAVDEDGSIYFGTTDNYFYAIIPGGAQKWRVTNGGTDCSPLISGDGAIYTVGRGASQTYVYLCSYNRDGGLNWQYNVTPSDALSSPVISKDGGTIYLASNYLYAIRKDNSLAWQVRPDSNDTVVYSVAISPDGGTLYVPGRKALYAVGNDGHTKWQFAGIVSNPAVDNDGNIYFGSGPAVNISTGSLYSLKKDGSIRWRKDQITWGQEDLGPVIGRDGTVYITGSALYAVDRIGNLKWQYDFVGQQSQCVPAIDIDGTLYVGKGTTRTAQDTINFLAINSNGTLKFAMCLRCPDGSVPDIDSRPAISADGRIYVGADYPNGHYVFKIK